MSVERCTICEIEYDTDFIELTNGICDHCVEDEVEKLNKDLREVLIKGEEAYKLIKK